MVEGPYFAVHLARHIICAGLYWGPLFTETCSIKFRHLKVSEHTLSIQSCGHHPYVLQPTHDHRETTVGPAASNALGSIDTGNLGCCRISSIDSISMDTLW